MMGLKKTKLTDTSLMPFGVHKGKTMANVPASYLLYLYHEGTFFAGNSLVKDYIKDNLQVLRMEAKREAINFNNRKNRRVPI